MTRLGNQASRMMGAALVILLLLPCMALAANPWTMGKLVVRQTTAGLTRLLQIVLNPRAPGGPKYGTINVESLPPGVTFQVADTEAEEGSSLAPSLGNFRLLPPGEHRLVLLDETGEPFEAFTVKVNAGEITSVKAWVEQEEDLLSRNALGIILLGTAGALGGCAVTFGLLSEEKREEAGKYGRLRMEPQWEETVFFGQLYQVLTNSCAALGVASAGFGAYLLLTDGDPQQPQKGELRISLGLNGLVGTW